MVFSNFVTDVRDFLPQLLLTLDVFHRDITATCPNGGKTLMSQQEERQEVGFQYNLSHNTTGLTDEVNMLRLTVHR